MPYCGSVFAGSNSTIIKGPRPRGEPLRQTGRPPWRQETVQDVEKTFLLAYNGTGLLRSCLKLRHMRVREGEVEKEHKGN